MTNETTYLEEDLEIRVATEEEMEDYEIAYNIEAIKAKLVLLRDDMMGEAIILKDISNLNHNRDYSNLKDNEFIEIEESEIYSKQLLGKFVIIDSF